MISSKNDFNINKHFKKHTQELEILYSLLNFEVSIRIFTCSVGSFNLQDIVSHNYLIANEKSSDKSLSRFIKYIYVTVTS